MKQRFPDGDSIEQDPRGQDPLVYYVPDGNWARAVGVEIEPLYEEDKASVVRTRFFPEHLARLESVDHAGLVRISRVERSSRRRRN